MLTERWLRLRLDARPKRCMVARMVSRVIGELLSECNTSCPCATPCREQLDCSSPAASPALLQSNTCEPTILRLNKSRNSYRQK